MGTKALEKRASELVRIAGSAGFESVEAQLELLATDDPRAKIGYLAGLLGIEPGAAFDTLSPLEWEDA